MVRDKVKIMRKIVLVVLFTFLALHPVEAARLLPQAKKSTTSTLRRASGIGITVSPRVRPDRKAIIVNFGNLQNANAVSYTLIYKTNGIEEAAGGTVTSSGNTATRELLFGTCSKNVCRYHANITNARLEVQSKLKSGKTSIKRYRVRV